MESLIKSKFDTDYPEDVIKAYKDIKNILNYKATVSNFMEMVKLTVNGGKDWELFDTKYSRNIQFDSFLIDCVQNFSVGKMINFTEIAERLKTYATFTSKEINSLDENKIENKLWAIFLVLSNTSI